jgi:hypothetical protein
MKTQVEFRSSKFPPYEGEEAQINPGLWGKRLAEYLQQKLRAQGVEAGEIYSEDWGWAVPIKNESFPLWIGCGHQYGDEDVFVCFLELSKPVIRKLFKRIDTTQEVGHLSEALETILASDPDIREVQWEDEAWR